MKLSNILHSSTDGFITFWCPGCACAHGVSVQPTVSNGWTWNGDVEKPTFSPSVLALGEKRCHSFIQDGKFQFLGDCEHNLKGQTVAIPAWPFEEDNV